MTVQHGQQRSSEIRARSEGCKPESQSRSMGAFRPASEEHGTYQVGTSGENSGESNPISTGQQSGEAVAGKVLSQLIDETEKQLAYHEQQAEILRERRNELKAIEIKE
nr:hypothetical protein [Tolypothrix sp. FACHB-123]